eukprot:437928_1
MSTSAEQKQYSIIKCTKRFVQCPQSMRIKLILQKYNKIVSYKDKTEIELERETHSLISNLLLNEDYSNVKLLNDFYHIKYVHDVNDNIDQFNLFYKYLFDGDNVLHCDVSNCESAKRYSRRNRSTICNNTTTILSVDLMSRIHMYFVHSYESSHLNPTEIEYIEKQLNKLKSYQDDIDAFNDKKIELISEVIKSKNSCVDNTKYMISDCQWLNYSKMARVLNSNGINTNESDLANAFDDYNYHKQQLIDDLCDISLKQNDQEMLLSQILTNELNYDQLKDRLQIYNIILCKFFDKHDLNNHNFVKILQKTVTELYSHIDCDKVIQIARSKVLSGLLFIKGTSEFKNSNNFGKLFKSLDNWKKKEWQKIYLT